MGGILLLSTAGFARSGTLIERTLAFVNTKPILLSDVALTRALLGLNEAEAIERTIDESLMLEEAARLLDEAPDEETVSSAVQTLRAKAGSAFTDSALRRKALVQIAISRYIELRLKSLVRVDDGEVRKVFNERVASEPDPPAFSEVAPQIRDALESRALDQRIEEWVASLRARADIRRRPGRPLS